MRTVTEDALRGKLRRDVKSGSLRRVAEALGVSQTTVHKAIHGHGPIGPKLAAGMGYVREPRRYRRVNGNRNG